MICEETCSFGNYGLKTTGLNFVITDCSLNWYILTLLNHASVEFFNLLCMLSLPLRWPTWHQGHSDLRPSPPQCTFLYQFSHLLHSPTLDLAPFLPVSLPKILIWHPILRPQLLLLSLPFLPFLDLISCFSPLSHWLSHLSAFFLCAPSSELSALSLYFHTSFLLSL